MRDMFCAAMQGKENGSKSYHVDCATARLLNVFYHWKFVNQHGQRSARLNCNQSIYSPSPSSRPRSRIIQIAGAFLFGTPSGYLRDLENIYVDTVIALPTWRVYIKKLQTEWQEFILNATVVLNSNVALLAIPDVILFPGNPNGTGAGNNVQAYTHMLTSPAAIASYISTIASIAAIVTGLLLVRQNRTKNKDDASVASAYMHTFIENRLGLEVLAILYSLPWALLMWSIISFLVSILIFTFKDTDLITRAPVAAASILGGFLVVCCVYWEWKTGKETRRRTAELHGPY